MIFDNIKNCKMYYGLNSKFEKAFDFIKKATEENFEVGQYEIDGKEIYAFVQNYNSKLKENSIYETHNNYIDIQYIIEGRELMGFLEVSNGDVKDEYNAEKDVTFYNENDSMSYCIANKGDFCIFYPHDIHSPGVAYQNIPTNVKKIVVKVHI